MAQKQLTDRDMLLLKFLSKCDVLINEQVAVLYGGKKKYHYDRLAELDRRGLIKRCGSYNEITCLGAIKTGSDLKPLKIYRDWQKEQKAMVAQIYLGLFDSGWDFLSSREFKIRHNLKMSTHVDGCLIKDGAKHAIYLLESNPSKKRLSRIRAEIDSLYLHQLNSAVVFYPTQEAEDSFRRAMNTIRIQELLFFKYPEEISLIRNISTIKQGIASRMKGYTPTDKLYADYEKGRTYVSSLILNDLAKKKHLSDYIKHVMDNEQKEVIILTTEEQRQELSSQFPKAKQILPIPRFWE